MHAVITVLLVLGLAGAAQAASGTLARIKERGEIRLGYREATEPFSFKSQDGQVVGYSIDLCERVAAAVQSELGLAELKTTFVPLTIKDRFDAVASGKVDLLCSATTITLGRMEKVDFTVLTFVSGGGIISRADAPARTAAELAGKTVAVVAGSTSETAFASYLKDNFIDAKIAKVDSLEAARRKLDAGEVDAVAGDQMGLIGQVVVSSQPKNYALAEDLYSYEPYGLAVARGDADFLQVANRALVRTYRTGQIQNIYDQWFSRIGLRPSGVLKAMFAIFSFPE